MAIQERKTRERAERQERIVAEARALAEAEGWDAVTVRKLAERIAYSQPVLYSHFRGRGEIVGAVALQGFGELSAVLRAATLGHTGRGAILALAQAYLAFAAQHPAVYEAMFSLNSSLAFATETTPQPLQDGFAVLRGTLGEFAGHADPEVLTETVWATLHGLVTLARAGRIPQEQMPQRLEVLVDWLVGGE